MHTKLSAIFPAPRAGDELHIHAYPCRKFSPTTRTPPPPLFDQTRQHPPPPHHPTPLSCRAPTALSPLPRFLFFFFCFLFPQLAGSEDAFRRLLDHEWDRFSASPAGTRGSFLVCSAPGRANAKRLRELAGAASLVETLHHRKGAVVCSLATLDAETAALVAADGSGGAEEEEDGGGGRGRGTFSLEPLPHLAKLTPAVAADPSPAALLLSSEAAAARWAETGWGKGARGTGLSVEGSAAAAPARGGGGGGGGGRGRGRRLRGGAGDENPSEERGRPLSAEERARVLAEAAAAGAGADRPTTRRLIRDGESGMVDAIEITLVNHHHHHGRRPTGETEELARRWLSLAGDQAALASTLKAEHFWGRGGGRGDEEEEDEGNRGADGATENLRRRKGRRRLSPEEVEEEEEEEEEEEGAHVLSSAAAERREGAATRDNEEERERELSAHEERKRLGWADLLDAVERGRGAAPEGERGGGGEAEEEAPAPGPATGSCRFDKARFTVSPSGKKILFHRPHEMAAAAAAAAGSGERGRADDSGCLSALLAYVSLQPEVRYVSARRKSATMNLDAAWVTQSGIDGFTPLWDEVRAAGGRGGRRVGACTASKSTTLEKEKEKKRRLSARRPAFATFLPRFFPCGPGHG